MKNITLLLLLSPVFLIGQSEINKPDRPTYYAAYDSVAGVYHVGTTEVGQVTTSGQPSFTSSPDALEFLANTSTIPISYDPLPAVGEQVEQGEIYEYEGALVVCRQTHARTIFEPSETPALFAVYRAEAPDAVLPWIASELVYVGTVRSYNSVKYSCIQQHQTVTGQTPDLVPALWSIVSDEECPEWVQPTGAQDAYNVDDCVTYEGQEWVSNTAANVWAPGVFGWVLR